MTRNNYKHATGIFSTQLAIISFIIGTLFLIAQYIFNNSPIYIFAYIYILLAIVVNTIILLFLIYLFFTQKNHKQYFAIKIMILLSNIPIAISYLFLLTKNNPLN